MRFLALALLLVAGPAAAAKPRLHWDIKTVSTTDSAPAEVSVKARTLLEEIMASRPEFAARAGKGVRAYLVTVNVDRFARKLEPNTKPGQSGQVLTISLGVQLVGSVAPSNVLALAGSGQSTVTAEVGQNLRPREEEGALDDALRDALTHAVSEAVVRLQAPPPKHRKK